MTPQELVTAAQNGDHDAFAELWRTYRPQMERVIYRRTGDRHLTEDLVSETFLKAWRWLPGFTWQGKGFGGWLAAIALNLVADHYKSATKRYTAYYPLNDTDDNWALPDSDRRTDPQVAAEQADLARMLDDAIAQLTPDQRQVISLRFGHGLSFDAIGAAMARRPLAARSVHWRALRALEEDQRLAALAVAS